jgi:glycosyltransferase involved in cell wall biosynthesis
MVKGIPLVTIITTTYNHEKFIAQCIESVLSQTYSNWEQIIIDDGSTDKTYEIVAGYKDKRIKLIKQENVGIWKLNETYNKALSLAKGELIAILEGDDFWPARKLEKQISIFNEHAILCFGKVILTNNVGKMMISTKNPRGFNNSKKEEKIRKLIKGNFIPAITVICRKNKLLSIGGFQQPAGVPYVDYPTWLKLSLIGEIQAIDEILGYWRRHSKQATQTMALEIIKAQTICCLNFLKDLEPEIINSIHLTSEDVIKQYRDSITEFIFYSGRLDLFNRNWISARNDFNKALNKGHPSTQIKSLFGIVCSYMHFDLEWIARLMKIPEINDLR